MTDRPGRPMVDVDPKPWFRQPGESKEAYETFCVYRDLLANRTIREAARLTGRDRRQVERWCRLGWVQRVEAWDHHLQELVVKGQEDEVKAMSRRQAQTASSLQAALGIYLNELADRLKDPVKAAALVKGLSGPDLMKQIQSIAWPLSRAAMLERIARGAKDGLDGFNAMSPDGEAIIVKAWQPPTKPQQQRKPAAVEEAAAAARADREEGAT